MVQGAAAAHHSRQLREKTMDNTRKLWIGLGTLIFVSFAVLLWAGGEIFRAALAPIRGQLFARSRGVVYCISEPPRH